MHSEPSSLPGQVLGFRDGKVKKTVPALKGFVGMGGDHSAVLCQAFSTVVTVGLCCHSVCGLSSTPDWKGSVDKNPRLFCSVQCLQP